MGPHHVNAATSQGIGKSLKSGAEIAMSKQRECMHPGLMPLSHEYGIYRKKAHGFNISPTIPSGEFSCRRIRNE
jgi:hypothetical protein